MNNQKTFHIFGGGVFVKHAIQIAKDNNWKVVLRTGDRFLNDLENYDDDSEVSLISGNSLGLLMEEGGMPKPQDIGISFSAPWVIPAKIINLFNGQLYNLHNQPLPRFRGCGGTSWNIMMNDNEGGCSIHLLTPELDAGEIFAAKKFSFPKSFSFPKDFDELVADEAIELLNEWLPVLLKTGSPGASVQNNDDESEYWPRLNTNIHAWIDWSWGLDNILSFCNAFSLPHLGAKTILNDKVIHITKGTVLAQKNKYHPFQRGIIYKIIDSQLHIAHNDGTFIVEEYSFESDPPKIRLGDRLFTPTENLEASMLTRIQYSPDGKIFNLK